MVKPEKRNTWERRAELERRREGTLIELNDGNFQKEMVDIPVFCLFMFSSKWSTLCRKQATVFRQLARDFIDSQKLRLGIFEMDQDNTSVPIQFGVLAIPTILVLYRGHILFRSNSCESLVSLRGRLREIMVSDTSIFHERRQRLERRIIERRNFEDLQNLVWHDFQRIAGTSPWITILCLGPDDPAEAREFSNMTETAVRTLGREDIRVFHVTGTPTPQIKRHFGLTVSAPAIVMVDEGKVIAQWSGMRTEAEIEQAVKNTLS